MTKKIIIIYDLKEKNNNERTKILQRLYGHRDNSNYKYTYTRKGLLDKFDMKKEQKTIITIKNTKDLAKISEILKTLNIRFEIVNT